MKRRVKPDWGQAIKSLDALYRDEADDSSGIELGETRFRILNMELRGYRLRWEIEGKNSPCLHLSWDNVKKELEISLWLNPLGYPCLDDEMVCSLKMIYVPESVSGDERHLKINTDDVYVIQPEYVRLIEHILGQLVTLADLEGESVKIRSMADCLQVSERHPTFSISRN